MTLIDFQWDIGSINNQAQAFQAKAAQSSRNATVRSWLSFTRFIVVTRSRAGRPLRGSR